ncbi:MAG TPA: hypothetical protein VEI03_06355 [Stellaceae bacterium]|nr:hypothetical protein [Stellaceae bacterium]
MTHFVETWRVALAPADAPTPPTLAAAEAELPTAEESDDTFVELSRRYPALSREIALYLAR